MSKKVAAQLLCCLVLTSCLSFGCSDSGTQEQTDPSSFAPRAPCTRPVDQSEPVILTRSLLNAANDGEYGCISRVLDSVSQKAVLDESDVDLIARDYGHKSQSALRFRMRAALDQGQFELREGEPGVSLLDLQVGGSLGSVQLSFVARGGKHLLRGEKTDPVAAPRFVVSFDDTRPDSRAVSEIKDDAWERVPAPVWVLKTARIGQNYRDSLAGAMDGATSYRRVTGSWPDGLVLDETSGAITGRPSKPGAYEAVSVPHGTRDVQRRALRTSNGFRR